MKSIAPHAFSHPVELERITISSNGNAPQAENAFDKKDIYVQAAASQAQAYRESWGLPVVVSVSAVSSLTENQCKLLTTKDAVELAVNDTQGATAPTLASDVPVWLNRTWKSGQYYMVCFPSTPTEVSVEGLRKAECSLSDIHLYRWENQAFVQASQVEAGCYLLEVPEAWSGKRVCLRFDHACESTVQPDAAGLLGNASTDKKDITGKYYCYDAQTNTFVLEQASSSQTVYPFCAVLIGNDNMPEYISAPKLSTGIQEATVGSSSKEVKYTPAGIRTNAHYKGITISQHGKKEMAK